MTISIDVDPVAFALGGFEIRWYGLVAVVAIFVAIVLVRRGAARVGVPAALVDDAAIWVGAAALVGGRVLYLLQNDLAGIAAHPLHALAIWHGGLSFYGGLVAGLIALWAVARRHGIAFGLAADIVAPAAAAGQAIGHIGCLIGGDSYGSPTSGPLAIVYRATGAMAPQGVPLHPVQLYEAVSLGLLAVALWYGRDRLGRLGVGAVAAAYLVGNGIIRFLLFFLRDDVVVFGGLTVTQLIALGAVLAGIGWLVALRRPSPQARAAEV